MSKSILINKSFVKKNTFRIRSNKKRFTKPSTSDFLCSVMVSFSLYAGISFLDLEIRIVCFFWNFLTEAKLGRQCSIASWSTGVDSRERLVTRCLMYPASRCSLYHSRHTFAGRLVAWHFWVPETIPSG